MKILNAFSFNMVLGGMPTGSLQWRTISPEEARAELLRDGVESCVGHADTANVISGLLGISIPANRVSVSLAPGERIVVAQYFGPRLPEGATQLPEGAKMVFILVEV